MARLTTRLDALESDNPEGGITRDEQLLLCQLLGRRDALYWPWRFQMKSRTPFAEIRRRQKEYLSGEIGLNAKAEGKGKWKEIHFMRQRLIGMGLIKANHSGGQVTNVFLTALGEATARAMVGARLHTLNDEGPLIIREMLKRYGEVVREGTLFGLPCVGSPTDWDDMTEMVLPLLTAGIVSCGSETRGRACYRLVTEDMPETPTVDVACDPDFDHLYIMAFDGERLVLESTEPRDPHEIWIPLPETGWGFDYEQK